MLTLLQFHEDKDFRHLALMPIMAIMCTARFLGKYQNVPSGL